jgi:hypothetical protein
MSKSRMLELAEELLRRPKDGKVFWEKRPLLDSYEVKFPDISLVISRLGSSYILNLVNAQGTTIESLVSERRTTPAVEVIHYFPLLKEIFELAQHQAQNVEENIDKALECLRRE